MGHYGGIGKGGNMYSEYMKDGKLYRYVCEDRTDETDNEDEIISKRNLSGDYDGDPKHPEGYIDNATEMSREEVNEMIKSSNPVTQLDNNTDGIHIDCYEYENNNIIDTYKQYRDNWINGIRDTGGNDKHEDEGFDMIHVTYKPKFKWFHPPFSIKIWKWEISMMWAYKIHKATLLRNCVPTSCNFDTSENNEISLEFKTTIQDFSPETQKQINEHVKRMRDNIYSQCGVPESLLKNGETDKEDNA